VVHLADVALLEGAAAMALGGVGLGPAPLAGETRTIDGGTILATLRRAGLDPAVVTYSLPGMLRVRRASQEISEGGVREILQGFLADSLGDGLADAAIRSVLLPGVIRIPAGPFQSRVSAPPGSDLVGKVRLAITFTVADRPVKEIWVTADIARFGPVVVARRAFGRGEIVGDDDVEVDRRELSELPRGSLTVPADAVGMRTKTPVLPYAALTRDQLVAPALVKRGDVVMLVVQRGGLRITAPGEAREDAARGAAVHVLNRSSHQEVVGRVQESGTVVVEF
jgi:flagella basal body P-ring formation protein FlgA